MKRLLVQILEIVAKFKWELWRHILRRMVSQEGWSVGRDAALSGFLRIESCFLRGTTKTRMVIIPPASKNVATVWCAMCGALLSLGVIFLHWVVPSLGNDLRSRTRCAWRKDFFSKSWEGRSTVWNNCVLYRRSTVQNPHQVSKVNSLLFNRESR